MRLPKMPPWNINPRPRGARYDAFVGPRCNSQSAPAAFGAVGENPNVFESCPVCDVSSTPQRDGCEAVFRRYAATIFTSISSTRGVVPRLRNRWLAGELKWSMYAASRKAPNCHSIGAEFVAVVAADGCDCCSAVAA